jgi:hypothetical protein
MSRKLSFTLLVVALALAVAVPVYAQKPDFGEHIYVDGEAWGTKATTALPAPKGKNAHSFDDLYIFLNQAGDALLPLGEQLLVADSAPGDQDYNGGRWKVLTAQWNVEPYELTSVSEVHAAKSDGDLTITEGSTDVPNAPPDYFECPLLPVKE